MKISTLFCLCLGALLFLGASKFGPPAPNWPPGWRTNFTTNGMSPIPIETATNNFHWETPTPSKVTIWFSVQPGNDYEFSPVVNGFITTNVWRVTTSNALEMVKSRFKGEEHRVRMNSIQLTGIWRDE